jgi:hypothetical protein
LAGRSHRSYCTTWCVSRRRSLLSPVPYEKPCQAASCRGLLTPLVSSNNLRIVSNARRKALLVKFLKRYQAQFLTAADKLVETAGKTTTMFEGAQQQVGDKDAHDLHRQGILTFTERTLELEHLLDPLPPLASRPGELHPPPLTERCGSLSTHTAPIRQPLQSSRAASARIDPVVCVRFLR